MTSMLGLGRGLGLGLVRVRDRLGLGIGLGVGVGLGLGLGLGADGARLAESAQATGVRAHARVQLDVVHARSLLGCREQAPERALAVVDLVRVRASKGRPGSGSGSG